MSKVTTTEFRKCDPFLDHSILFHLCTASQVDFGSGTLGIWSLGWGLNSSCLEEEIDEELINEKLHLLKLDLHS